MSYIITLELDCLLFPDMIRERLLRRGIVEFMIINDVLLYL